MLTKTEIKKLLAKALETGADFAEIFIENTNHRRIQVMGEEVTKITSQNVAGVGVRILKNFDEAYGYTNNQFYPEVEQLILDLRDRFSGESTTIAQTLSNALPFKIQSRERMEKVPLDKKIEQMLNLSKIIKAHSPLVSQSVVSLIEWEQSVLIANTDGIYQDDIRPYTRVLLNAVVKQEEKIQDFSDGHGGMIGFEIFKKHDFNKIAKEAVDKAIVLLGAKDMKPQIMDVVMHNGFGGVIFHEACGHPLEASSVSKGLSPFANKLGEKIASDIVTAYDDGTIENSWGNLNFDDEGMKTQKNLLIENGILKGYLIDSKHVRKMKMNKTASGRRQSYKYSPTSRMNSTYIAPGKDRYEDIIKSTKYGLFAKSLGGGTVVPSTGEFNFVVREGYMIRDGKIAEPVKGAMLIGQASEILHQIDMVADNLSLAEGMCGASSGSIPVDVGQPTIRVKNMTVGGAGENE